MQHQMTRDKNKQRINILRNLLQTAVTKHNEKYPLAQCLQNNPTYMAHAEVPHFFSNELEAYVVQQALSDILDSRKMPGTLSVAILTGEAFALSRLPELSKHVDVVLMADINPAIHQHNAFMRECMQQADDRNAFIKIYLDQNHNPILEGQYRSNAMVLDKKGEVHHSAEQMMNQKELRELLDSGRQLMMQHYHFLSSDERYTACKTALAQLPCIAFHGNWTQPTMFTDFRKALGNLPILFPFVHISNVQEYDANRAMRDVYNDASPIRLNYQVIASLRALCDGLEPYIHYTHCEEYASHGMLRSKLATTIKECENAYREHEKTTNKRDASSPYHLESNINRGAQSSRTTASTGSVATSQQAQQASRPWDSVERLFDEAAPIRYGYQLRMPQQSHPVTQKLNDFLHAQQAFNERFVAYPRYDNEIEVAALLSTTVAQARIIVAALTSIGIKAKQIHLTNLHEVIIIERIQQQTTGLARLMAMSLPAQEHQLDFLIQHNLVMKFVTEPTFYSRLPTLCPTIMNDIQRYIVLALQRGQEDPKLMAQATLVKLVVDMLNVKNQDYHYQSPLPKGDMLDRLPTKLKQTPMSVLLTINIGLMFCTLMDRQHLPIIMQAMEKEIQNDQAAQRLQFSPFCEVSDVLAAVLSKDGRFTGLHWCAEPSQDGDVAVYSIQKFTERQKAQNIAAVLKEAGAKVTIRQLKEGRHLSYRVVLPDVPAFARYIGALKQDTQRQNQPK